jgi:hypothetical protein
MKCRVYRRVCIIFSNFCISAEIVFADPSFFVSTIIFALFIELKGSLNLPSGKSFSFPKGFVASIRSTSTSL